MKLRKDEITIIYRFVGNVNTIKELLYTDERSLFYGLHHMKDTITEIKSVSTLYANPEVKDLITLSFAFKRSAYKAAVRRYNYYLITLPLEIQKLYTSKNMAEYVKYNIKSPNTNSMLMGTVGGLSEHGSMNEYIKRHLKQAIPLIINMYGMFSNGFLKKKPRLSDVGR